VPQIGDIIFYETAYYEIVATNANQYFVGKDPDYPNILNPEIHQELLILYLALMESWIR
jgi:hypothetical protein